MKLLDTKIPDLKLFEINKYGDSRGFFCETWHSERYSKEFDLDVSFVQDNLSKSSKGVLRGLHIQLSQSQGKLVSVPQGAIYDVVVDLRKGSKTFGAWEGFLLSEENNRQLYVPEGFAHGFLSLEDNTFLSYKCTDYYAPQYEKTLLWNDSDLQINWDEYLSPDQFIISDKDKQGLGLNSFKG